MNELKNLEPKLSNFLTTIKIPVRNECVIWAGRTIHQWVELFAKKSENSRTVEEKRDADMCRIVAEWAGNCEATLVNIFNDKDKSGHILVMELKFNDVDQLSIFAKEVKQKVSEGLGD